MSQSFFAVNLLFISSGNEKQPLWEESIVLISAEYEEEAIKKAKKIALEKEHSFKNSNGESVSWKFSQIERVFQIDDSLENGCELFSRFLNDREVKSILNSFDN